MARRLAGASLVATLCVVLACELRVATSLSVTFDEVDEIGSAVNDVTHGQVLFNPVHPPLARIAAGASAVALGVREGRASVLHEASRRDRDLEWAYGSAVVHGENADFRLPFISRGAPSVVVAARLPMVLFPLAAAVLAYVWASVLWGRSGGLVSLLLVATLPDLLGHGALVASDVPYATAALAAGLAAHGAIARGGAWRWLASGVAVGLALAAKFSALFLLLSLGASLALAVVRPEDPAPLSWRHPLGQGSAGRRALLAGACVALVALVALLVLRGAYLGADPVRSYLRGLAFVDRDLVAIARADAATRETIAEETGVAASAALAHAWILKTPLGTLALLLLALLSGGRRPWREELRVLAFPAVHALAMSLLALPLGARYLLPSTTYLCVAAGRLGPWAAGSWPRRLAVALALGANVAAAFQDHPFHANATNALARLSGSELADSNVDWGGGLVALGRWQRARGIERLVVVPFAARPYRRPPDVPAERPWPVAIRFDPWMAELAPWGVQGAARSAEALFAPTQEVYAVSAAVLARARVLEARCRRATWPPGGEPPRLVLGGLEAPDEAVGGFLIFDRRPGVRRR